jgi:hypothetical protein
MNAASHLRVSSCVLAGTLFFGAAAGAAPQVDPIAAFVVHEATAGADLNGDGDAVDYVVHVSNIYTGVVINLSLATPVVCEVLLIGSICRPVAPVTGDTVVAFLVGEAAHGDSDLNGDGDAVDAVLYVYDAQSGVITETGLAAARGVIRTFSFTSFPIAPVVAGDLVVFLVGEPEQGGTDLNNDSDASDDVLSIVTPKTQETVNLELAAPTGPFFGNPVFAPMPHGNHVTVMVGEPEQGSDLNRDGDADDQLELVINLRNGRARLAR